jgi:hypothetical protein
MSSERPSKRQREPLPQQISGINSRPDEGGSHRKAAMKKTILALDSYGRSIDFEDGVQNCG